MLACVLAGSTDPLSWTIWLTRLMQ
jgi:hypothetical protein